MTYREIRPEINDGDVIFVNGQGLTSRIIGFITKSKFSHVGIAFWIESAGTRRLMMVEAQGGASRRIVNMSNYEGSNIHIIAAPRPWEEYAGPVLRSLGNVPYGWFDAIYVGVREFMLKYFNIKISTANFPGEICSEFVATQLQLPQIRISPQLLYEQLLTLGHKVKATM